MSNSKEYRGEFPVGHIARPGERRGSGWCKELLLYRGVPQYKPNSIYKVGRYYYETDPIYRRVCKASGELILGSVDRHTSQQRAVGKLVYLHGDVGGHLLGCIFYGSGHPINMVPMNSKVNHPGAWSKMENDFRRFCELGRESLLLSHFTMRVLL